LPKKEQEDLQVEPGRIMESSSRSRSPVVILVALALIAWSVIGCKPPGKQTSPREKFTFAYTTAPDAVLVHIAFAKGFFAEEGLDATPQPHAFGKLALESVVEGKADLAAVGDTPFVFAVMNGRKITTFATILTSNRNNAIVARQDRGIVKPSDFLGKRVGFTPGSTSDYFLSSFLLYHGIDEKQVRRVAMNPGDMAEALDSGEVDAVSAWNPILRQLQKKFGSRGVTFFGESIYTEAFSVAAMQEYVKKNPETVKKVLRALIKAEAFVKRHPEESRRLVAEFTKTDKAIIEDTWDVFTFEVLLDQGLLVNFENQTRWVIKNRLAIRTDLPNYLDYIYDNALRSVKPEAVRIVR
jgi:ABC-type nitrate/sulfonate/bicarbonate transport system substrate-binding protein